MWAEVQSVIGEVVVIREAMCQSEGRVVAGGCTSGEVQLGAMRIVNIAMA